MQLFQKTIFILLVIALCSSCSQKFYFQDAQAGESRVRNIEEDSLVQLTVVKTRFAGDAIDYIVFELDIVNNSDDTLFFDHSDIKLRIDESPITCLSQYEMVEFLQSETHALERERKRRNTSDAIFIGLDILSFAFAPGISGGQTLFYGIDAASYVLSDRRQLNLAKGSIEEQIVYVEDWVVGREFLPPYAEDSWDILFERLMIDDQAILEINLGGQNHYFDYDLYVAEGKN